MYFGLFSKKKISCTFAYICVLLHVLIICNKFYCTFITFTLGLLLLLTMVVPKGVAVIILAWIGTISCSIAFGAGYTYTKVSPAI